MNASENEKSWNTTTKEIEAEGLLVFISSTEYN